MIDLKLTEIFSVLGVGIFVVISFVYFFFLGQRLFHIKRHNKGAFFTWLKATLNGNYKDTGYAIVTALVVYSTGILTQDITDHMTDSERNFNPLISFVRNVELLPTEAELRKAVLIEDDSKLTGLGGEVFANAHAILSVDSSKKLFFFDDGNVPGIYWFANGKRIQRSATKDTLKGFINGLYYTSKNWCYLKAEPIHKELDNIQERIDFSRSICIISFLSVLIILLMHTVYYMREYFFKKKSSRFKVVAANASFAKNNIISTNRSIYKKIFLPFTSLIFLCLIIYASRTCYAAAEKNFNERAMGYYISELKFQAKEAKR